MDKLKELLEKAPSRRQFLAGVGATGAAAVAVACGGNGSTTTPTPTTTAAPPSGTAATDLAVLNFALNLEYLEAEFYLRASTGTGIPDANVGSSPGTVTGGTKVPFSATQGVLQQYAAEIAQDELNHVLYLRAAIQSLGGTAIDRPTIDLTGGFAAIAAAAKLAGTFNPFADPMQFLVGAFVFEDVGVTAYHGGALLITNKTVLTAAASIHAVEAYHAAEIRTLIAGMAAQPGASQTYLTDVNAISNLRAALGGGMETMVSTSSIVAADPTNSIGFKRSTDNVLHIVYGTAPGTLTQGGAFFPKGLNGGISTPTS